MKDENKKRSKLNATIPAILLKEFEQKTKEKFINKSLLLENFIKEWLEKQKN